MSEEKYFKHESYQDRESISNYIREILNGLEKGVLHFSDNNGETVINPEELMLLEIKVKKKGEKTRVSLKIEWKDGVFSKNGKFDSSDEKDSFLKIDSHSNPEVLI